MSSSIQETKTCKHCQSEIPKKAKVCPVCRKKQGLGCLPIIIVVIVLFVVLAAVGGGDEGDEPGLVETSIAETSPESEASTAPESEESEMSEEKTTFGISETAELNDVQVTMLNYTETAGSEFNKPADGNVFVLVEFEIANNSDSELAVSSMLSFDAYADDYALNYSLSATIEAGSGSQLDGAIAPGKKMNGEIGYEVPADWSNIEIHFTDNVWSSSDFVFVINKF